MLRCLLLALAVLSASLFLVLDASAQIRASIAIDSSGPSGSCMDEIIFKGSITAEKAGRVQYRIIRSDSQPQPVETIEFAAAGTREIVSRWTVGGKKQLEYSGWQAIQILYPEELTSQKAEYRFSCDPLRPDLAVRIKGCPASVRQGADLRHYLKLRAYNFGGTDVKGAAVELHLKKEQSQNGSAENRPVNSRPVVVRVTGASEAMLLKAGQKTDVRFSAPVVVPQDTHDGDYALCAVIYSGDRARENNELNNTACCPVKISSAAPKPDLVIERFAIKGWGRCEPGEQLIIFEVTVKNIGSGSSPSMLDKKAIVVNDIDDKSWSNGAGLGAIPPGGRQTVTVPIYYHDKNRVHMLKTAPHPFRATIDPNNLIEETNRKNNKSDIIYLDPATVCAKDQ